MLLTQRNIDELEGKAGGRGEQSWVPPEVESPGSEGSVGGGIAISSLLQGSGVIVEDRNDSGNLSLHLMINLGQVFSHLPSLHYNKSFNDLTYGFLLCGI